jgi:hypothetical protein
MPVAAIATVLVLGAGVAGAALLAASAPEPSVTERTRHPAGPWLVWARDLGFAAQDGDGDEDEDEAGDEVALALDALTDAQLGELDGVIAEDGQGFTVDLRMRLASRLFAGATAEQVDRLHSLVPSLEPGVRPGESWERFDVDAAGPYSIDDVHQGNADDCWLLAGFGALAVVDPGALAAGIRANDNGTYTLARGTESVTVSPYLPVEGGRLVYAHADSDDRANWTSVFEKAHAALPAFGSYAALAGGSMIADSPVTVAAALTSLTGLPSTTQPARSVTLAQLQAAVDEGLPTTATTFITSTAREGADEVGMVDRHVYVVVGIEGSSIVLRNPWGYTTAVGPETVRLGIDEFNRRVLLVTFGGGD